MPSRHSITNKCQQGWALKNWCFRIAMMEKTLESPLDCKEIKPVNPKGNQSWIFIGRTDAENEALILWPPDVQSQLMGKTLMLGKIEGRRRRGQQRGQGTKDNYFLTLSITNPWSLLKLMSNKSAMPPNCHPLLLPSIFPSIRVFSSESGLHIRWPKY